MDGLKISIGNEFETKKNDWALRSSSFISEGLISYISRDFLSSPFNGRLPQGTGCGQSSTGGTSGLPFLGTSLSLAVV